MLTNSKINSVVKCLFSIVLVTGAGACSKKAESGDKAAAGKPVAVEPSNDFMAKSAAEDVVKIKAALAAKTPGDASLPCASAVAAASEIKDAALKSEVTKLCSHDAPLAVLVQAADAAEAARAKQPDEPVLEQCFNAEVATAEEAATTGGGMDEAIKAALARYKKACPKW